MLAATTLPASAQYETTDRDKFALRVGLFRPAGNELKDIDTNWLGPAVDYYLKYDKSDRPTGFITGGFYTADKSGISYRLAPLTYTWLRHFSKSESESGWYAGGGAGLYFLKFESSFFFEPASKSSIKPGLHIVGGYEFGGHYFAEYQKSWVRSWLERSWSGSAVYLGARTNF